MANNKSIQVLRGSSGSRASSNESLLAGQPFYEWDTNKFYIGGSNGTPLSTATPVNMHYDIVITTQAEFDDWCEQLALHNHEGKTVCILELPDTDYKINYTTTLDVSGLTIHGIGTVSISGEGYYTSSSISIFKGESLGLDDLSTYIEGIHLTANGSGSQALVGFENCTCINCSASIKGSGATGFKDCYYLINCSAYVGTATSTDNVFGFSGCDTLVNCWSGTRNNSGNPHGFSSCKNLTNCVANVDCQWVSNYCYASGFASCTDLINCNATAKGAGMANGFPHGIGFTYCTNLTNCTGIGNSGKTATGGGDHGYGFENCKGLCNCIGTGISSGSGSGYGFSECDSCVNCRKGSQNSTTSVWNGGTHINKDTCPDYS